MAESARRRCNMQRKDHLINYMIANKDLALGTLTGPMGVVQHNEKWTILAEELANLGPNKTVDQWLTTWRDLKSKAKSANAKRARALQETGNPDRPVPELNEMELKILSVIGRTTSEGMEVPESSISGAQPARQSPPPLPDVSMYEEFLDEVLDTERGNSPPPPQAPTQLRTRGLSRPRRQPRRSVQALQQQGIGNIYAQSQQENLAVLKESVC